MDVEYEKENRFFIYMIIGIISIVILSIILLFIIWKPDNEEKNNSKQNDELYSNYSKNANYSKKNVTISDVVDIYSKDILLNFLIEDEDKIFNMISEEYMKTKNYNKDDVIKLLRHKGILGVPLKVSNYKSINHNLLGRVYELEISTNDNSNKQKIIIIEKSPNNYKISFDGFISSKNYNNTIIRDGLKMTIRNIVEYSTKVYISCDIENISTGDIILNTKYNYENGFLKFSINSEEKVINSNTWLAGQPLKMTVGTTLHPNLEFNVSSLNSGFIKSILLTDVYNDVTKETKDIEFELI